MAAIQCGAAIYYPRFEQGTAGCLMRFTDSRDRVLLLTAGHVVLPSTARQNDPIYAVDIPGKVLGTLRTWTNFQDAPTADAAFIWVDPTLISPAIPGLGTPTDLNFSPQIGDTVRIVAAAGQTAPRTTIIQRTDDVDLLMPMWNETITYRGQLLCQPMVTVGGDSGALAVDDQNRVVGIVVSAVTQADYTVITPISAILSNSAWQGAQLELVTDPLSGAVAPLLTAPAPPDPTASVHFGSLVPNGYYSSDPYASGVPRSIRTNNPGALNFTRWQANRPGFVGKTEPDGSANHNVTTIYRTPEHGIASWFYLLSERYGFGTSGPFTVGQLAQRYAGCESGPPVDDYIAGWSHASGSSLSASSMIDLNIDQQVLGLARAMFAHEAGQPSPLGNNQIQFAVQCERQGTLPN